MTIIAIWYLIGFALCLIFHKIVTDDKFSIANLLLYGVFGFFGPILVLPFALSILFFEFTGPRQDTKFISRIKEFLFKARF